MNHIPPDFHIYLKKLFNAHGVSISQASRDLGFTSKTSLFRILNNEASFEKKEELFRMLVQKRPFELTDEELSQLRLSLNVSRIGLDSYRATLAMAELVIPGCVSSAPISLNISGSFETCHLLSDLLTVAARSKRIRMTIVGCCVASLFAEIQKALSQKTQGCDLEINHYFDAPGAELIYAITAIQPLFHAPFYYGACLKEKDLSNELRQLYRNNTILLEFDDQQGKPRYIHLTLADNNRMAGIEYQCRQPFFYFHELYQKHSCQAIPIRTLFAQPVGPEDCLNYTYEYFKLEKNANLYEIKSNMPIYYIHPDILVPKMAEDFTETDLRDKVERAALIEALYNVQLNRWTNFDQKRRVTHTIFSYDALCRFARTGKLSTHFIAMRSFLPTERKAVLSNLRHRLISNPYFNYYFFKPGIDSIQNEIGMYEGKGVLFTKGYTGYRLEDDHAEALITQSEFCSQFKEYFLQHLLTEKVTTKAETLAMTDQLIAMTANL